ncbi:MAG: isoprenylcysteine carboxylmethyltransferase family protein [Candidatus Omnitrophica bacterium]|nr:isoprenylcysteine carboxylmethyltransferase family protein [Candidatus Omnitrophota bacterium]
MNQYSNPRKTVAPYENIQRHTPSAGVFSWRDTIIGFWDCLKKWPRFKPKKARVLISWAGVILLFFVASPNDHSFRIGMPILCLGEVMRIWAAGFLEKKGTILATNGPFAYVRNPLYIGNFLIGLGIIVICRNAILTFLFVIGFVLSYWATVRKEEKVLFDTFGDHYSYYVKNVPRFIPKVPRYCAQNDDSFRFERLFRHKEHVALIGIVCIIVALYLREEMVLEGEFAAKQIIAAAVLCLMGVVALFEFFMRGTKKWCM